MFYLDETTSKWEKIDDDELPSDLFHSVRDNKKNNVCEKLQSKLDP